LLGGEEEASEDAVSRDDRVLNPAPGIWAITGGKLTTYRAMAKRLVDGLVRESFADRPLRACSTTAPLPSAREILPGDASPVLRDLWSRYGAAARSIERLANEPELSERIDPGAPFVWAEVEHALDHEWVERLDDLLDRRLGAFLLAPECDLRPIIARWLEARGHHVQSAPEPVPHF
jgi:glycerol-3-phosphate dehydrogenase